MSFGQDRSDLDSFLKMSGFQESQGNNYSVWKQCYSEEIKTEEACFEDRRRDDQTEVDTKLERERIILK